MADVHDRSFGGEKGVGGAFQSRRHRSALELSAAETGRLYRGVDGEPWPNAQTGISAELIEGLAPLRALDRVRRYRSEHCPLECNLLCLSDLQRDDQENEHQ
jgi:hypothetical protein